VTSTTDVRRTRLLTDLARFSVGDGGAQLEASSDVDKVRERTGFPFTVANDLAPLPEPPAHVLEAIHTLDPDRYRAELVGA